MSLYKRGEVWWYKFKFDGATIRESTGLSTKDAARDVEDKRRIALREGRAGIVKRKRPVLFFVAADAWFKAKQDDWAPKTAIIEKTNLTHLRSFFGTRLLTDIEHEDVTEYKQRRTLDQAAPKTISLELGTLRAVMLYNDLDAQWSGIRKKIEFGKARKVGHVLTVDEEKSLLQQCCASRSRSLSVAVTLALQTCMRYSEIRLLRWRQVDFGRRVITVGESKTYAGAGREIPMTATAFQCLGFWAANFPNRKPSYYVFPAEKYGAAGDAFKPKTYDTNPAQPIGTWKEAWEAAKLRAGVECRFHDLRHSGCTHLLEAGVSINDLTEIMGWSTSTAIRMVRDVYGHVGPAARRQAMDKLEVFLTARSERAQKWAQSGISDQGTFQ
jgi:integrase